MRPVMGLDRERMNKAGRCANTVRPLTHSLDRSEEGLAMKATPNVKLCAMPDCEKAAQALGRCAMHQNRMKRTGTAAERFWSRVDQRGPGECWPWLGTLNDQGYGRFYSSGSRTMAHRVAYELAIGPIPEGLEIDHVKARGCTRLDCVNPAHLEAVTRRVNNARSDSPSALNGKKSQCHKGHEFRGESGHRRCPVCRNAAERRRRVRKRL